MGENYTKISLRCCGAGGQGDRGEARSLAGGMNSDSRKISAKSKMGFGKDLGKSPMSFEIVLKKLK